MDAPANCAGVAAVAGLRHVGHQGGLQQPGTGDRAQRPGRQLRQYRRRGSRACSPSRPPPTPAPRSPARAPTPISSTSTSAPASPRRSSRHRRTHARGERQPHRRPAHRSPAAGSDARLSPLLAGRGDLPRPGERDSDLQTNECSCTTDTCGAGMANAHGAVLQALRPIAAVSVPAHRARGGRGLRSMAAAARPPAAPRSSATSGRWPSRPTAPAIQNADTAHASIVSPRVPRPATSCA